ncbi:MAG: WYL domain-containing protein [Oscillospiraceae bacterium]|nr:WYL domain-containing protein [Oscillospiraceae bacterium]
MDNDAKLRPLYLAKILYEQTDEEHFLTTAQLIQILEDQYGIKAHRQTIKAEIELLKQFGLEIEEVKSTQNRYNLFGRRFDAPELKLLIDAVESSKFITAGKSKELVEKISSLTSTHVAASLRRNVSCEGRIKPGNERIYIIIDAINDAINKNKKISFQYFQYNVKKEKKLKRNGEPYVITPLHLVWNGDCYYMVGVYEYKQRLGSFRVDRIAKCPTILEEEGTPAPEGFNIDEHINTTFHMFSSAREEVELVCDNDVMDSIIDRFGEDVTTYANDMTSFRAVVNIAVSHVFYSWVFGFGGKVKIKGPDIVKEKYAEMLNAAVKGLE